MQYRYLALPLLLAFLTSCTPKEISVPGDFDSLYKAHVKAQVETLSDTMEDIGYLDSYGLGGSLRIAGSMPSLFSGVLSTEFMTEVSDARDAKTVFKNTLANYEILGGSGSLKLDEMSIIAKAGDVFVRFAGIEGKELITPEMQAVLTKYNNTWLAMTEKDILDSMSGGTEEEIMSYQISQALTQMSLEDIEKYLTTYPIWKEIKSVGMSGSLHQYEVELAKENVIAIAKDFSKKATGKDLSAETLKSLTDNLSTISLKGIASYNSEDAHEAGFEGTLTDTSEAGKVPLSISLSERKDGLSLSSGNGSGSISLDMAKGVDNSHKLVITATEGGKEMAQIIAKITKEGEKMKSLDVTLTTPELTFTMNHTNNADGTFEGKINGGIGNITWKGKTSDASLRELHVAGGMMGGINITADLIPGTDGILRGPIVMKSGEVEAFRANGALALTKERFFLSLDIPSPTDPSYKTYGEIDLRAKKTGYDGTIEAPKDSQSLQKFTDEMDSVSPSYEESLGQDTSVVDEK